MGISLEELKQYLTIFGDSVYIQALAAVVIALILAKATDLMVTRVIGRIVVRTKSDLDDVLLDLLHRPVFLTVGLIGLLIAFKLVTPEEFEWLGEGIIPTLIAFTWLRFLIRATTVVVHWMSSETRRFQVIQPTTAPLFDIGAKVAFTAFAAYFILITWGIEPTAWLASAGILGLAVGLAAQDTLANLFAGVSILADSPYRLGDYIVLDGEDRGKVTRIGLRSTRILTRDAIEVTIPNSTIAAAKIVNESGGPSSHQRVRIRIGVAYGSNLDRVEEVLKQVARDEPEISDLRPPLVRVIGFGDSSVDLELRGWIEEAEVRGRVTHKLNKAIYEALGAAEIEIPYPKRDLYIKEAPRRLGAADFDKAP